MTKLKFALFTLVSLWISVSCHAQSKPDSLWSVWKTKTNHDTTRLNALQKLARFYQNTNPDTATQFASMALDYSRQKKLVKYVALSLHDLALINWTQGNLTESLALFNEAEPIFKKMDDKKSRAGILINKASIYHLLGNTDSAFHLFKQGVAFCESFGEQAFRTHALVNLGNLYSFLAQNDSAEYYYMKAIPVAKETDNLYALAVIYSNLGSCLQEQGNFAAAFDYYDQALLTHRNIDNPRALGYALKELAGAYHAQKDFKLAHTYLDSALSTARGIGDKYLEASILTDKAGLLSSQKKVKEAMALEYQALRLGRELQAPNIITTALSNIGSNYHKMMQLDSAKYYFEQSLEMGRELEDAGNISFVLISLGIVYRELRQPAKARVLSEEGMALAQEAGNLQTIIYGADNLVGIYSDLGLNDKALEMHALHAKMLDSLHNEENRNASIRREFKFAYENKALNDSLAFAAEKAIHDQEIQRRKLVGRGLTVGLILMAVFAVVFAFQRIRIGKEKKVSEALLHNILPAEIAAELKEKGEAKARAYEQVSILFTDFKEFTKLSEKVHAEELVSELNYCFKSFDAICEKYGIEKIKTLGDSFMATGGLPVKDDNAVKRVVRAALEMQAFIKDYKSEQEATGKITFEMRAGIHTGRVVAGIVGVKKFQYDIWGDTVNMASRMESHGEVGKVNISHTTYELIKDDPEFSFEHRGKVEAKGKGEVDMYFATLV